MRKWKGVLEDHIVFEVLPSQVNTTCCVQDLREHRSYLTKPVQFSVLLRVHQRPFNNSEDWFSYAPYPPPDIVDKFLKWGNLEEVTEVLQLGRCRRLQVLRKKSIKYRAMIITREGPLTVCAPQGLPLCSRLLPSGQTSQGKVCLPLE